MTTYDILSMRRQAYCEAIAEIMSMDEGVDMTAADVDAMLKDGQEFVIDYTLHYDGGHRPSITFDIKLQPRRSELGCRLSLYSPITSLIAYDDDAYKGIQIIRGKQ
jgi:hypothetical protein